VRLVLRCVYVSVKIRFYLFLFSSGNADNRRALIKIKHSAVSGRERSFSFMGKFSQIAVTTLFFMDHLGAYECN
jgi:hypothetical protein